MQWHLPFEVPLWTYPQALHQLKSALRFGIQPMLESVEDMLSELKDPDLSFDSIQIAGTNGKTSTARYTAAILAGEGYKVGLYTSPGLTSYTDRMEIAGKPVSEAVFARGLSAAMQAGLHVNERRRLSGKKPYDITEFDLLTIAATIVFAEAKVDVVVLECGMGGRWDATSAIRSILSVAVTGVGLDHMKILGDTLEKISAEKAAIIKKGRTCVLGVGTATPASVEDVFLDQCSEQDVKPTLLRPLHLLDAEGELHPGVLRAHEDLPHASYEITRHPHRLGGSLVMDIKTPQENYREISALKPGYQAANIACAVVVAEGFLGHKLDLRALFDSVVCCPTPGRFDVRRADPLVVVDACHNPQSVATFIAAVRQIQPEVKRRPALLCAVLSDKDVQGIVGLLAPEFSYVVCAQTASPRALPAAALAEVFSQAGRPPAEVFSSVAAALSFLTEHRKDCVACGSITTAGEVVGLLA
jgi:dihydrofolate synthase/folylpolyglutamate synthase